VLTWNVVLLLSAGVYGQRVLGALFFDTGRVPVRWQAVLSSVPLAIISAVIALQTLTAASALVLDERVLGLAAAAVCASRRLPIFVTVTVAALVTAGARQVF
jgi:branched-subunit amino acid transport protein